MEDWVTLFDPFRANWTMTDWLWELWHLISKGLVDWSKLWQILLLYLYYNSNVFTIYSVVIYWDMSKYSLSSLNSSKKVKKCYSILHENPPPYETENWVTPFPCSLPRPTHIKLSCNVCNGWGRGESITSKSTDRINVVKLHYTFHLCTVMTLSPYILHICMGSILSHLSRNTQCI